MRLSEILRLGYSNGTPTLCGKRGRHNLEDLLEVDALRARRRSFRAGADLTSPQLEILAAARYLVYGSHRTPTVCPGTTTAPSPQSSSAAAASEAEGAASSIPSATPTPAAAVAEGHLVTFAAAAGTASQLIGGVPYSTHPLTEHPIYCYFEQQQPGYCYSAQQQHQQQHDSYYTHQQQLEYYCYQQQPTPQDAAFAASQPQPDAQAWDLMLLQQQQARQLGSQFYPQLQQQQDMCVGYTPSSSAHPSQAPNSNRQLPVACEAPAMHLQAPIQRPRMYYPAPTCQPPSTDLPSGPQPTGGPAELDSDDLQAGLSEYHSDQDDVTDENDDGISDNGTELGSEFDSEPENLVDRSAEAGDAEQQPEEGPGFDSEGTSDFEDAVDDYGTTEEEEENNSIPPAELEAILAENARLWGHLVAQGAPHGIAA